jgi:aryl-alcohol dehydrogenase-like predicted oxidoreductase
MELRQVGNSDIKISKLGVGCWSFGGGAYWGDQDQQDVDLVVNNALDLGMNYFDTAEMYNDGASEQSLGNALKDRRFEAIIGTKISPSNCEPTMLRKHVEESLQRLQTDYIDIYMLHWPITPHSIEHFTKDEEVIQNPPSIDTAFQTLIELQDEGKLKYIGVSNHGIVQMQEVLASGSKIIVNELPYNLVSRAIEQDIVPFCAENDIGIFGYMALQQGLLAGIYDKPEDVPAPQAHSRHFQASRGGEFSRHGEEGCEEELFTALAQIKDIAAREGVHMAQLSLAWAMADPRITCTLVGSRNLEELKTNVNATEYDLSNAIISELNEVTQPILDKLGNNPDYYEPVELSRIK